MSENLAQALRRVISRHLQCGVTDCEADADALQALADRLSLEGPPRVGDLVEYDSVMMNGLPSVGRGIVVAAYPDDCEVRGLGAFRSARPFDIRNRNLRIVARAAYDVDTLGGEREIDRDE